MILVVLLMHSINSKISFPSRRLLAEETGFFVRTIDKAIKHLEELRFIKVDKSKKVNSYKLNF